MTKVNSSVLISSMLLFATCLAIGCIGPQKEITSRQFVFETVSPSYLAVNEYQMIFDTLSEAEMLKPRPFKCRIADGKLHNIDYLAIAGNLNWDGRSFCKETGDTAYYRRLPVVSSVDVYFKKKYTKYYIPDRPLYWEFKDISIVSNNASFGADYPVGSDLTPIVLFGFPSLYEFIQNGYKGPYTTEHLIRANDKKAWANLILFETGKPKLIIERLPTEVVGSDMPSITIRLKFIDKKAVIRNQQAEVNHDTHDAFVKPHQEVFDLPVTLLLDIQ